MPIPPTGSNPISNVPVLQTQSTATGSTPATTSSTSPGTTASTPAPITAQPIVPATAPRLTQIFDTLQDNLNNAAVSTTLGSLFGNIATQYTGGNLSTAQTLCNQLGQLFQILRLCDPSAPNAMHLGAAIAQVTGTSGPVTLVSASPGTITSIINTLKNINVTLPPRSLAWNDNGVQWNISSQPAPQRMNLWQLASIPEVTVGANMAWFQWFTPEGGGTQYSEASRTGYPYTWPVGCPRPTPGITAQPNINPMSIFYNDAQGGDSHAPNFARHLYFPYVPGMNIVWVQSADGNDTHQAAMGSDVSPGNNRNSVDVKWVDSVWPTNPGDPKSVAMRITMPGISMAYSVLWGTYSLGALSNAMFV
ncbi:MAG: hypothetical protein ACOYKZ_01950 [Chlamydiia bacterium]